MIPPNTSPTCGKPSSPANPPPAVTVLTWRDRWLWDTSYVILMAFVPVMLSSILVAATFPFFGVRALLLLSLSAFGLIFAPVYGFVGSRVRRLKAGLAASNGEVTEALFFRRPWQTPGLAVLYSDRLELLPIVRKPIVVPISDISTISEVTWFNGTRLWWKRGFVLDLKSGDRIGVAVPEPFGRRWRASLSNGALHPL